MKKADDRHAKLFLCQRSSPKSKKRQAEDDLMSDKTKLAKSVIPSSAPSVIGAYPNAPNQWTAGYGVQPQAWATSCASSRTTVKSWLCPTVIRFYTSPIMPRHGYRHELYYKKKAFEQLPEAVYGAYSSYGSNYTQPQVPASVPQSAAYAVYPRTYPAQALAQQSYTPVASAATLTPAQPAAAVALQHIMVVTIKLVRSFMINFAACCYDSSGTNEFFSLL